MNIHDSVKKFEVIIVNEIERQNIEVMILS